MKPKMIVSLGVTIIVFSLTACTSSSPKIGNQLTGKVWILSELAGNTTLKGTEITAQFTNDSKISGSAGCNQYLGTYNASGNKITFSSPMATTMMMCEEAVMHQETTYLTTLGKVNSFTVNGDQLTLLGADKSNLAVYQAQTQGLAGTSWNVISYNNGKQAVVSVMLGTNLTAEFSKDGIMSGNSGCNRYQGSYKINGNQISIGPLAATKKYCTEPAGAMDQESQYLAAFETAANYQIEGDRLQIRTQEDALVADFTRNK
jgi:heat shock protein HslJ